MPARRVGTWEVRIDGKLYVGRGYLNMANAVFAALRVHENAFHRRESERQRAAREATGGGPAGYRRQSPPTDVTIDVRYAQTPGPAKMQAA